MQEKLKNKTLIFVAATVAIVMAVGIAMFFTNEQAKADAKPSNARTLEAVIVWSDNVEPHLSQSSVIALYQNGVQISKATLSINNSWQRVWEGLDPSATYDVRQLSTFENYYTTYAWDANNNVTIKNILNGSPVPPWPTPTPEPSPEPGTNIIIEYYEDGTPVTGNTNANNQNAENKSSNNNDTTITNNTNNSNEKSDPDLNTFLDDLTQNINKTWMILIGLIGLFALFLFEKISARKKK